MKKIINGKICDTEKAKLVVDSEMNMLYDSGEGYLFILDKLPWNHRLFLIDFDKQEPFFFKDKDGNEAMGIRFKDDKKNVVHINGEIFNFMVDFKKQQ